jgi:diguanylate cyclase (GGDEF)-like protein/PAS domain S-box-containing protein
MNPAPGAATTPNATPLQPLPRLVWWQRLHQSLLFDYNRKASIFWWVCVMLGSAVLLWSFASVLTKPPLVWLQTALGVAIALMAGFFPVRIPRSKNSFAAGEIFIFLLLLVHGPEAAVLAAAGEGAVGSWRTSKRWSSRIASPTIAALSIFVTGSALTWLLAAVGDNPGVLIVATMAVGQAYFLMNIVLVTTVARMKRNERLRWSDLFGVFGWVSIAYAGSAAVASLLYLTYQQSGSGVLMAMVPMLGLMLATLHYFFRQQEAAEAVRQAGAEAQEREKEVAQRHVQELQASERRFHSAFTHASIGMALLSFDGRILQANPALRSLLGRSDDELCERRFQDVVLPQDRAMLQVQLGLVDAHEFEGFAVELRCCHSNGEAVWVAAHCSFFSEPGTGTPSLILQVQDITARRTAEEGLHHIAFHDALTGLPNRRRFYEHLEQAVQACNQACNQAEQATAADPAHAYAVMFLDFDRFKLINDSLGHSAGDEFLVQVSHRIQSSLRPQDIVARLGGDEFGILVRELDHESAAVALADRLMDTMRQPFMVAGTELMTSASIGITFSALGYTDPEDVLRDADTAMYKAKSAGKARYALFDASLHTEVAGRLRLEGDLRRAIDEGRLTVAYQPVSDLSSGRITGFEALVRWHHPVDGTISPDAFLPIAEEAGLMLRLTDFVMHCACRQLREWQLRDPAYAQLTMNVNLSGHDVAHAALVARVTRALVESGLQPRHLCLELTENILMSRIEGAVPVLGELRRLGVTLAIDDFGTGYSSLSHLSTLPIDCLKIDRSFVSRLDAEQPTSTNEAAVVRSIILLGSSLGKVVVAEGIETPSQLNQLRDMGCRLGQGYLLARPLTAVDIALLLPVPAPTKAATCAWADGESHNHNHNHNHNHSSNDSDSDSDNDNDNDNDSDSDSDRRLDASVTA